MNKLFTILLSLTLGTASFAQKTDNKAPVTAISITKDQKLKLVIEREDATAKIMLRTAKGEILYSDYVGLQQGILQTFDIAQLGVGAYELAVSVGKDTLVKTFLIEEQPAQKQVLLHS